MKKILILFLLSFPIIIFTIVTLTSSVIAYYVPLAVEGIEIISGEDIADNETNQTHELKFQILPANARDMSFAIIDELGNTIVDYNQGEEVLYNNLPTHIIEISHEGLLVENGLVDLSVKTNNIGYTRLTIVTKDGNHRTNSDIMVLDKNADPKEIQGVVLDYNKTNEDYIFGNQNSIEIGFTYFPKQAINPINDEIKNEINNALSNNALDLDFKSLNGRLSTIEITELGRGKISIRPSLNNFIGEMTIDILLDELISYTFNVNDGYNIYKQEDLFHNSSNGDNLYLLNHIELTNIITFRNGVNLYGNNFQIDHSGLSEYTEKNTDGKLLHIGRPAISFIGNNSGLHNIHIVGALDENMQPYENIVNVRMDAQNNSDKYMQVHDVIIENGRYNLSVKGKMESILETNPSIFDLDDIQLIGAYFASLEIDSNPHGATNGYATEVNLSRLHISYTAIGVLIQNNRGSSPGNILNLVEENNVKAITSTSWRNLDDATGALSANNFGYIMNELKTDSYSDVYFKEGKNFYVNPVIMLRGGGINISKVNYIEDDQTMNDLIEKVRVPKGMIEMGVVGGSYPFVIYLLDPKLYKESE